MPRYYYEVDNYQDVFEIKHELSMDKFKNFLEVWNFIESNPENKLIIKIIQQTSDLAYFTAEDTEKEALVVTRIIQPAAMHFNGQGWSQNQHFKYSGKNKKLYDKLREERSRRKSKNLSVADVAKAANITGTVDGVVPDKKWDTLTKEQKNIANDFGLRQSRDYLKN